jgi:hypothetical protein
MLSYYLVVYLIYTFYRSGPRLNVMHHHDPITCPGSRRSRVQANDVLGSSSGFQSEVRRVQAMHYAMQDLSIDTVLRHDYRHSRA